MLIETDVILAHVKEQDWLKPYAEKILEKARKGIIKLYVSREVIHELYYIASKLNIEIDEILRRVVALTRINNIMWLPTTVEIDLAALTIMVEYGVSSIFDAYYAATALIMDPDKTIISTDKVYDKIPGLVRIDPRELVLKK